MFTSTAIFYADFNQRISVDLTTKPPKIGRIKMSTLDLIFISSLFKCSKPNDLSKGGVVILKSLFMMINKDIILSLLAFHEVLILKAKLFAPV